MERQDAKTGQRVRFFAFKGIFDAFDAILFFMMMMCAKALGSQDANCCYDGTELTSTRETA
jgi:hypothetical protein